MARNLIPSDAAVKAFRTGRRLSDGEGLYLLLMPSGTKTWRFDYRHLGKDQTLSMGVYPAVSLSAARRQAEAARAQVAEGKNPSEERKLLKHKSATQAENLRRAAAGGSDLQRRQHHAQPRAPTHTAECPPAGRHPRGRARTCWCRPKAAWCR